MNKKAKKTGKEQVCTECKKRFSPEDLTLLPFCSKRCKMIDLGHWLSEKYVIEEQNPGEKKNDEND